jgi:transcriptional regulator with XRE-family HTH domain
MTILILFLAIFNYMKAEELLIIFGQRVRRMRNQKNISQEGVGYDADLTGKQHMSKIEVIGQNVQMTTLHKVATAVDVSMSYLLDFDNSIKRSLRKYEYLDKDILLKKIGQCIHELRVEKHMEDRVFSKLLNRDSAWLAKIEAGSVDFTFHTLYRIAAALKESMARVVDIHKEIKKEE